MQLTVTKPQKAMGARLKAERERLGYTELQIAQLIGIPLERYQEEEEGKVDPGIFCMPRLSDCGFDVLFIITGERYKPMQEESELLKRFRELSLRGRDALFTTLDALESLAPNIRATIRSKLGRKNHED